MGILTRFTLRSLARNRARTVATVVGIALSCALVTAIFTTVASIGSGLLQRTLEADGSWQLTSPRVSDHKLSELRADDHVTSLAAGRELGSAKLPDSLSNKLGSFLTVKSLPTTLKGDTKAMGTEDTADVGLAQAPTVTSGRLPQAQGEIALPKSMLGESLEGEGLSSGRALELGSTVNLTLGDRIFTDGETGATTTLSSMDSYATAKDGWSEGTETLERERQHSYTVVGFFEPNGYYAYFGNYVSSAAGSIALVAPVPEDTSEGFAVPYLSTDFTTYDDLKGWADTLLAGSVSSVMGGSAAGAFQTGVDSAGYVLHSDLLRYQGMTDDRAIWGTLWALAAILSAVVMVASVSLIYTSFAISVTERMRQFGLLAGIGASRRQLRRTVVAEALALGCVGIPAGLALGVAGTAATISVTQDGFAAIMGTEAGVSLVVDARVIALSAGLALVTLLVSAWVPAARAGRVSAVDAIRQTQTVREGRLARLIRQRRQVGLGSRLARAAFGASGLVAHRNLTRASSRGRIVVVSLAVSVALVIVCGAIDAYMRPIANLSGTESTRSLGADLYASAHTHGNGADPGFAERFRHLAGEVAGVEGASQKGYALFGSADVVVPSALLNGSAIDEMKVASGFSAGYEANGQSGSRSAQGGPSSPDPMSPYAANGDYTGTASVYYLDDASWVAYLGELGLDPSAFSDPARPRAVALNVFRSNDGQRYLDLAPFTKAAPLNLYSAVSDDVPQIDGYACLGIFEDDEGSPVLRYFKLADDGTGALAMDESDRYIYKDVSLAESGLMPTGIEVAALADKAPAILGSSGALGSFPVLIMPMSALDATARTSGGAVDVSRGELYLGASDPEAAEESVSALMDRTMGVSGETTGSNVYNIAADRQANIDASRLIRLLVLLFSVITMFIALANVFNTLTNSIILRTREFAVLRSIGMDDRAFARMIVYECASYAWRGLASGLVLGLGVSWMMWQSMQSSFVGLPMAVPWPYIGAAAAAVLVVLGLSVLYALGRTHRQNLVDALRTDAL